MKAIVTSFSALSLDLIHGHEVKLYGTIIFGVAACVWPAVAAVVVAVSTNQPAHAEYITI